MDAFPNNAFDLDARNKKSWLEYIVAENNSTCLFGTDLFIEMAPYHFPDSSLFVDPEP